MLRFGIPDFKLGKDVIDRRLEILEKEGIVFQCGVHVGVDLPAASLQEDFDALLLCGGATVRRKLPIPGSDLNGVVQQGAKSVINFEILDKPPAGRPDGQPWPFWPMRLRTSSSHREGAERFFSISTRSFNGNGKGDLKSLVTVDVEWTKDADGRTRLSEIQGTEKEWPCDLALLALGFTGSEPTLTEALGLEMDPRTNIRASAKDYKTSKPGVFAAGDQRRGQSLIVWAISEGRQAAHHVDAYLMGKSHLPLKGEGDLPRL